MMTGNMDLASISGVLDDLRHIIETSRRDAVRSVDFCRVRMYWELGQRIVEEEQNGELRAHYGSYLLKNLALKLETEYGSGFSLRQLERARQFYRTYPIASALRPQLNWSQYKMLISIDDEGKREKKSEPGLITQNAPQLAALPIREFILSHRAALSMPKFHLQYFFAAEFLSF